MIADGTATRTPQNHAEATMAPMLKKEHGRLDLTREPKDIINLIRGLHPWPGAYIPSNIGDIKVHKASITADGKLQLEIVQAPGKRAMSYKEFLNGNKNLRFG